MSNLLADASVPAIYDTAGTSVHKYIKQETFFSGTPIEDFSSDSYGLENFCRALTDGSHNQRPVRIAFLGDSFTEGDILTSHLRDSLQNAFGGRGIGYVPIVTPVKHRNNAILEYRNWTSRTIVRPSGSDRSKFTLNGQYFIPEDNARFSVRTTGRLVNISGWGFTDIVYSSEDSVTLDFRTDSQTEKKELLKSGSGIKIKSIPHPAANSVEAVLKKSEGITIHGIYLNDHNGIYVDNFSLRSSSGPNLELINYDLLSELDSLVKYDLVILQYGLNVAEPDRKAYPQYREKMTVVINKLKNAMPNTDFLVMSVSDRSFRGKNGELRTMPGVKNMVKEQRSIATETGITFWSTFDAMGGDGSMVEFVRNKLASTDYTHINYSGGKVLGEKLATSLIEAVKQYDPHNEF
ncbi:MAG: hypothetical protein LIO79_00025 [Rikenellaceae bacterium]|nr:hypothetical protein [Rikenellaceae bacterium]